jgi:hypothetical protein
MVQSLDSDSANIVARDAAQTDGRYFVLGCGWTLKWPPDAAVSEETKETIVKTRFWLSGRILLTVLLALSLFLSACEGAMEQEGEQGSSIEQLASPGTTTEGVPLPPRLQPILVEGTMVLDQKRADKYLMAIEDESVFTFSKGILDEIELEKGTVFATDPTAGAPYGLLRKVTKTTSKGDQVQVETEQASLADVIETAVIYESITLTEDDILESWVAEGVTAKRGLMAPAQGGFSLDIDGNFSDDRIRASGRIDIRPSFDFDLDIRGFDLKRLLLKNTTVVTGKLKVETKIADAGFHKEVKIADYTFSPIPVLVGKIPVVGDFKLWLTPKLSLVFGVDGKVSAGVTMEIEQGVTFATGLRYEGSGDPEFINEVLFGQPKFERPTFSAGCQFRAFVGPRLTLLIQGVPGPYAQVDAGVRLTADPFGTPRWELTAGIKGEVGVKVEILKRLIAHWEWPFDIYDWEIAKAESQECYLTGTVYNREDNQPLPDAAIGYVRGDAGGFVYDLARSDPDGHFEADCSQIELTHFPLRLFVTGVPSGCDAVAQSDQYIYKMEKRSGINIFVSKSALETMCKQ